MKHIHEIDFNGLVWVNITRQTEKELNEIKKRFGFLDQDIKECLPPFQRSKIVKRNNYYFMVLHFPIFDRETGRLGFTEVDFFLTSNFVVTVHSNKLLTIDNFFEECQNEENLKKYFQGTAVRILFELLERLLDAIFPILLHVNDDINLVDRKLFGKTPGRDMAEEILRLKTNIVTFRRTMQGHRTVLERLIMYSGRELDIGSYQSHINSLREFTNEIWHMLESQRESVDTLHQTSESLIGLRTNEIMKTLTVISVITFPLTLFVALFDFNTVSNPFREMPGGFWVVTVALIFGAIFMLAIFKKKKWM